MGARTSETDDSTKLLAPRNQKSLTVIHFGTPRGAGGGVLPSIFAHPYSTFCPSASKVDNSHTLWVPEFRRQTTVRHFWPLDIRSHRQSHTLGLRRGPAEGGSLQSCTPLQHFRPLGFKSCQQSHTWGARIIKTRDSTTLLAPRHQKSPTVTHSGTPEGGRWRGGTIQSCTPLQHFRPLGFKS